MHRLRPCRRCSSNGTLTRSGDTTVFRVADSDHSYTVCEETRSPILSLEDSGTHHTKGKVVSCSEGHGEELVIESAGKI